jgi:hypothetical protein
VKKMLIKKQKMNLGGNLSFLMEEMLSKANYV